MFFLKSSSLKYMSGQYSFRRIDCQFCHFSLMKKIKKATKNPVSQSNLPPNSSNTQLEMAIREIITEINNSQEKTRQRRSGSINQ